MTTILYFFWDGFSGAAEAEVTFSARLTIESPNPPFHTIESPNAQLYPFDL